MLKELTDKQIQESVAAVRAYIKNEGGEGRHEAFVKTLEKEESYPVVLFVFAEVYEKSAKVIVEWYGSCGKDYPTDFLTNSSIFQYCRGSLHIESEDDFGRKIGVSITKLN